MKKLTVMLLSFAMLLSLAACGGQPSGTQNGSQNGSSGAAANETIKIGVLEDLSGDFALVGNQKLHAAQVAVEEINKAGGVLGRQLEIIAPDAQSDTDRTVEMARKLILEDQVAVVMGPYTSAAREAIRPLFEDNGALLFYNNQYEGGVASHNVFCTGAVPEQQVLPLVEYLAGEGAKTYYILTADYNFGWICADWFKTACDQYDSEIVGEEFVPLSVGQFASSISKIQLADPDVLIAMPVGNTQTAFYEQWNATQQGDTPMCSTGALVQTYEHKRFAAPALNNMYVTTNYLEEIDSEASNAFKDAWHAMFPDEPYIGEEAEAEYVGVHLWAKAVEQAGTTEVEAVISALETGISIEAPSGTVTVDPATHHCIRDIYLVHCDEQHKVSEIRSWKAVAPDWLSKAKGIDLTKSSPNEQYTPID